MDRRDLSALPAEVAQMVRTTATDDEPVALCDGEEAVAWIVSHHEYARLIALAHRAHGLAGREGSDDAERARVAKEVEDRKAANVSVQKAYADRQALWTIKA